MSLVLSAAAAVAIASSLMGCSTSDATTPGASTPRASASSTPDAAFAARVQINGDSLDVLDSDGKPLGHLPYSDDITKTVESLETLLSEKSTHTGIPASQCNLAEDSYGWGDALTIRFPSEPDSGWTKVLVTSRASTIGKVTVGTPGGLGVGDDSAAVGAAIPGATTDNFGDATSGGTQIWYDIDAEDTGVVASTGSLHGEITIISAPVSKDQDC